MSKPPDASKPMNEPALPDRTLQYLLDAVSDYAIYMLDPSGRVTSWNTGAHRLKGYTLAEIEGRHFSEFFTPEDRAANVPEQLLARAAAEGRAESEGWRVRKDGGRLWVLGTVHAVRDERGQLIGFAKVTRDMTRQREAQVALADSERRFRTLVSGVVDYAIFMLDPKGIITNWNAGAQQIKGYAAEEIVGQHFSRFYTAEDQAEGRPARALKAAAEHGRYEAEGWRVRKDGTLFWASVVIDAIREPDGSLLGFAKITRDITDKRQAQLKLESAQQQLAQSQKLEALGKLTGGVAHDFNNLLMIVSGRSQLLRRKVGDDPQALRALEAIEAATERGAELTRHLLSFARRQRLTPAALSLVDRAPILRELVGAGLPPSVRLEMSLPPDLWPVVVDPGELDLSLINLAVNARDAMPDGGALQLSAANRRLDGTENGLEGDFVVLSLADTGVGIPAEILPRIFDPFFTTKPINKGTGLGLSQVYGFAQQCGGHIEVASTPGEGSTFTLYLPRSDRPPDLEPAEAPPAPSANARILLVEDNAEVAEVAARMLQELGHQVQTTSSGEAALSTLRDMPVDLVFSDIMMAGELDGLALARRLREALPGLPILLATGYSEAAERIGDEFPILRKPYRMSELNLAIAQRLAQPRSGNLVNLERVRKARTRKGAGEDPSRPAGGQRPK